MSPKIHIFIEYVQTLAAYCLLGQWVVLIKKIIQRTTLLLFC